MECFAVAGRLCAQRGRRLNQIAYFQVLDAMGPDRFGRHSIAPLYHTLRGRRRPELVRRQGSVKIPAHPRNGGA
mgnify:FL=1